MRIRLMESVFILTCLIVIGGACRKHESENDRNQGKGGAMAHVKGDVSTTRTDTKNDSLSLTSSAFAEGEMIPVEYTCDGDDRSPALSWHGIPEEATSLALICSDPDAPRGIWYHWVVYNIPPDFGSITGETPSKADMPGGTQGINDFGHVGYGGPCPPSGVHRYRFTLYALDLPANLEKDLRAKDLLSLIDGHVMAEVTLTGRYERK
jgi:Raf kinase inhibitor-like YbhB/YbcL family protein